MSRERIAFIVTVDLDPMAGVMSTVKSAKEVVQNVLNDRLAHYNPTVELKDGQKHGYFIDFHERIKLPKCECGRTMTYTNHVWACSEYVWTAQDWE